MPHDIVPVAPRAYARYLGVCVRPDCFGFVVIEDTIALDCGVRACERSESFDCLSHQFERILRMYVPTAVIVLGTGTSEAKPRRKEISKAIVGRAKGRGIPVILHSASSLKKHFRQLNAETKYEIASAVVRILPELAWRLPPKRKAWQSERRRTAIFEAAAAVIAHAKL
jgi:hypothetical protein